MENIKHKIAKGSIRSYMQLMGYLTWTSFWSYIYYIDEEVLANERMSNTNTKGN